MNEIDKSYINASKLKYIGIILLRREIIFNIRGN